MKTIAAVEPLEIGRQDERGRRIADDAEKEKLLVAFAASGMTQRVFARREGINYFAVAGKRRPFHKGPMASSSA